MSANPNQIPVHQFEANQAKPQPRFVSGFYQNIRLISMYSFMALFFILPWLRYDGRQAIWFDVPTQHYYIFGLTFFPQDFYYIAFVFIIAAFALFVVTVYAGRVWCGYACPQTIWTHLYQYVEKWIIGDRNKRIKFYKQDFSLNKGAKLSIIYFIWLVFSIFTATTFVSYVASTDVMYTSWQAIAGMPFPEWDTWIWVSVGIFTFATLANAGFMREGMCIYICPYGRFQSVMFDKDTLIVSYDYDRGEPRGARKKGTNPEDKGDCVNCHMCVQVCPTGIDIRDGLQYECIQCAACVDACNEIMDKVGYKRGLIRYTTERQLVEKQKSHYLRPKLFAYLALISILVGGLAYTLVGRVPVELVINRDRNQMVSQINDGMIENSYTLKITNKTQQEQTYEVSLLGQTGLTLDTNFSEIPLMPGENYSFPIGVVGDTTKVTAPSVPIRIQVQSQENPDIKAIKSNVFTTQASF